MVYASVDDLEDYLDGDPTPAHPERLLERASNRVDMMLKGCVYPVEDGVATEPEDVELLRDLTVRQATHMAEIGDLGQYSSVRTSTVSWTRPDGTTAPAYAPEAVELLAARGWPGRGLVVGR